MSETEPDPGAVRAHARRRHLHSQPSAPVSRTGATTAHPRALHVPCRGGEGDRGCGAEIGFGCEHPTRGRIPGFVHPSRTAAEAARVAGLTPRVATLTVVV